MCFFCPVTPKGLFFWHLQRKHMQLRILCSNLLALTVAKPEILNGDRQKCFSLKFLVFFLLLCPRGQGGGVVFIMSFFVFQIHHIWLAIQNGGSPSFRMEDSPVHFIIFHGSFFTNISRVGVREISPELPA